MRRLGSAIQLILHLPQVWVLLVAVGMAAVANGWEPFVDIALYAVQRLSQ